MGRTATKEAIKSFLETVEGVKTVYDYAPKAIPDTAMPAIVIDLPDEEESRATMTAPVGRKKNDVSVELRVMDFDTGKSERLGEKAFDNLVDRIKAAIRQSPDLGGAVHSAGQRYIRTSVAKPRLAGKDNGNLYRMAVIEFDAFEHVVG